MIYLVMNLLFKSFDFIFRVDMNLHMDFIIQVKY